MTTPGILEIVLVLAVAVACAAPVGRFLATVMEGGHSFLSPVMAPVERALYGLSGVDPARGMSWRG